MAVYSMTGYASASCALPSDPGQVQTALRLEARSVNNRFLDLSLRLPDALSSLEPTVRARVATQLRRGKVELRVHLDAQQTHTIAVPTSEALQQFAQAQAAVRAVLSDAAPLSVAQILQMSNTALVLSDAAQQAFVIAVDQLLNGLKAARAREGQRLCEALRARVAELRTLAQQAQPLVPQLIELQRQRFLDRFADALHNASGSAIVQAEERALSEAAAYALRIDVAEELTRLCVHLDEIDRLLLGGGELGKRLDFLIQELHREANTLGSKSAMLELTRIAVEMKILIEQMREQVQNIE